MEFEGWKNSVRLSNGETELVVTTEVGPRILRYGFVDGPNAFHVIEPGQGAGSDKFVPYGGHRFWIAPEANPRSYDPDNVPVETVEMRGDTLYLANPVEKVSGFRKEIFVTLAGQGSAVKVAHRLTNHNVWPVTVSAWSLNIVANGGYVVLPQEEFVSHDDYLLPARPQVLWKFTDQADPRWRWGKKYVTLAQSAAEDNPQKVGVYNTLGWSAHVTPEQVFIASIDVDPRGPGALPDWGCNYETYTDGPFQELESLGPLTQVEPGEFVEHVEYWTLAKTAQIANDDASLDAHLAPIAAKTKQELAAAFGR
ncbi:hypothetical protein CCAX7_63810 [Capsulimonas corticalis]|uniref:DUF4380 domain-containing protein n=1 Tax=Capsulimonas corticalis TaxID=2219043 RepID=A0A9N7QGL8_9BACT|nr:hypothetical protein CCAX7_63810 [Capsulimonas corticalis]